MLFISRKAPDSRAAQRLTMERILTVPRFMAFLLYYFQIHLRHLLAPFPFWRPLIPLSVALLRCVSFTLARMKNSRRILAHSYLEIVLYYHAFEEITMEKQKNARKRDSEFPPSLWGCEITSRSERIRQRCGRRRPCRSVRCRPDGSSRGCRRSLRPQHTDPESRCRFHPAPAHWC